MLAGLQHALDHRILALIPRQGIRFNEIELKALLAYLSFSFSQLQAGAMGRVAVGVALLELAVKPPSSLLILDVKRLPGGVESSWARRCYTSQVYVSGRATPLPRLGLRFGAPPPALGSMC